MTQQGGELTPGGESITRAKFRVVQGPGGGETIDVLFNPESLEYTVTNNIQQRGNSDSNKQYVSKSSGKLSMDLVFDTTDTGTDVRDHTERMQQLMRPGDEGRRKVASIVEFRWGAYKIQGVLENYKETLDFFSPTGVPLRASVSVSLSQQDGLFEATDRGSTGLTEPPLELSRTPGQGSVTGDPQGDREVNDDNGEEQPRFPSGDTVQVPSGPRLRPPSRFAPAGPAGIQLGGGLSLDVGLDLGFDASMDLGLDVGLDVSLDLDLGLDLGLDASLDLDPGLGVSASLGLDLGTGLAAPASGSAPGIGGSAPASNGTGSGRSAAGPGTSSTGAVTRGRAGTRSVAASASGSASATSKPAPFVAPEAVPGSTLRGPQFGGRASAGVPATQGAFAGLRTTARPRVARPFRPSEAVVPAAERALWAEPISRFEIGGRAFMGGSAGLSADVGAGATLTSRIQFDEEPS